MIEHKSVEIRCKGLDDASGSVELYAAVFGNVDRAGERIEPGAFKNLPQFVNSGWLAVNHDWSKLPVAMVESASQDGKGLLVRAKFHSTPEAQAVRTTVRERLAAGKSVSASIGYKVLSDARVNVGGKSVRSLKAIDLFEASIVAVGCNPEAGVIGAKGRSGRASTAEVLALHDQFLALSVKYDPGLRQALRAAGPSPEARLYRQFLAIQAKYGRP